MTNAGVGYMGGRKEIYHNQYLKGKDIKVQGDCLVYCYTKKIKFNLVGTQGYPQNKTNEPPEGFDKW